jgi:hypothetical protein
MKTPVQKANEIYHKMYEYTILENDALQCSIILIDYILEQSIENNTNNDYDGQYYIDNETGNIYGYDEYYKMVKDVFIRNIKSYL